MPKSRKEISKDYEDKKKAKGQRKFWAWAYPQNFSKLRAYANLLNAEVEEARKNGQI